MAPDIASIAHDAVLAAAPVSQTAANNVDALAALSASPHVFLQPTTDLHGALLDLAKRYLDPLAHDVTEAQLLRQQEARRQRKPSRKRKRQSAGGEESSEDEAELLRMRRVHVQGFEVEQVWQQARRVLGAAVGEVKRALPAAGDEEEEEVESPVGNGQSKAVRFDEEEYEIETDGDASESFGEEGVDWKYDGEDSDAEGAEADADGRSDEDSDSGSRESAEDTPASDVSGADEEEGGTFVKDKHGLNDGFFSIDHFNKRSEFLERQDAKGDPDDGAASDEEDINWGADPLADSLATSQRLRGDAGKYARNLEDQDDESEDGPTFGNMDLRAPEGDSDDEMDDEEEEVGDFGNTNDILYADFFAPPPRKAINKKKNRGQNRPERTKPVGSNDALGGPDNMEEDAIEQTMSRVHRDLFEDDLSEEDDQEEDEDGANGVPSRSAKSSLSTHERAQQDLRAQIRALEADNVAAKPWSLTGEAVSSTRPLNSLLEEDLDFERAGKPVPVITSEVSESIEELVKRRIIALEFDEVIRRRPTDLGQGSGDAPRRGRLEELSDQKPAQGLADEYADDYAQRLDPNAVDPRSNALRRKHAEIESLWTKVSGQLDALSNWHYKPKPATATLEIRVDAPTIRLEEARPDALGGVGESVLAPQEMYKPGEGGKAGAGEIVTKGGLAVGREEMSKEQRTRRRRREKERQRKAGEVTAGSKVKNSEPATGGVRSGRTAQKKEILDQLKKGGVKVIGKSGQVSDINGQPLQAEAGPSGSNYKL